MKCPIRQDKDKEYNKGFEWTLSNAHREFDECDLHAGFYERWQDIPPQHPNCMCDIRGVPMTREELRDYLYMKYGRPSGQLVNA